MNRLRSELQRLYGPQPWAAAPAPTPTPAQRQGAKLPEPETAVRAMVMALTQRPSWAVLAPVWRGVQSELGLPAPAIAVCGADGLQLWFSLAEPLAVVQAHGFLQALRAHFLPEVETGRMVCWPHFGPLAGHTAPTVGGANTAHTAHTVLTAKAALSGAVYSGAAGPRPAQRVRPLVGVCGCRLGVRF
jgi:hypothetical protein